MVALVSGAVVAQALEKGSLHLSVCSMLWLVEIHGREISCLPTHICSIAGDHGLSKPQQVPPARYLGKACSISNTAVLLPISRRLVPHHKWIFTGDPFPFPHLTPLAL